MPSRGDALPVRRRASAQAFGIDQIVGVFVEDGLKIVLGAIGQDATPVVILGVRAVAGRPRRAG